MSFAPVPARIGETQQTSAEQQLSARIQIPRLRSPDLHAKHCLDGPEFRLSVKPTKEDEVSVIASAGHDMFPTIGDTWRGSHSEERTRSRMAEAVQVVVGAEQSRRGYHSHSSLLGNLSRYRRDNVLSLINTTCGHLRASLGMISVLKDQMLSSALDVDDYSLPTFHPQILGTEATAEDESRSAAALGGSMPSVGVRVQRAATPRRPAPVRRVRRQRCV